MPRKFKILSIFLCFLLIFQQSGFAQIAGELDLSGHFLALRNSFIQDRFRPLHLRYLSYDPSANNFNLLLDKGDFVKGQSPSGTDPKESLQQETKTLLNYFFIGISLPNEAFWVNLRPDAEDNIIDRELAETDVGKILLEADLQLKKDTANFTSPQTLEGKEYWDKLYKKAEELYGSENITIPTLTRPWIVPDEIIIRESSDNAYIYKATLKVMLEQDYLRDGSLQENRPYAFKDTRSKVLNEYSSQLIRETIIPKLTKEINSSKRYAPLRQVYYSLILAQWFKQKFFGRSGVYSYLIDRHKLDGLTSKTSWSKTTYFNSYKTSFQQGEYNIKEPRSTLYGQSIRSYMSGGLALQKMLQSTVVVTGNANKDAIKIFGVKLPNQNIRALIRGSRSAENFIPREIRIEAQESPAPAAGSPVVGEQDAYVTKPIVAPQEKIIGDIVTKNGDKLYMRQGQEDNYISIVFYNTPDKAALNNPIGFVDINTQENLINYIYIYKEFRRGNYSGDMLDAVLAKMEDGTLTGQKATFAKTLIHNPLLVKVFKDRGFDYIEDTRINITVVIPEERSIGKIPIFVENPNDRMVIEKQIRDDPEWQGTFELVDKLEGRECVIFASYIHSFPSSSPLGTTPINQEAKNNDIQEAASRMGGIDMRSLAKNTVIQPMASAGVLKQGQSPSGTTLVSDKEWQEIERMASSGIAPSCERIREYLLSLQDPSSQTDQVLACIADILRQEEEKACGTESSLKEILVLLESDKPANELRLALVKVEVLAKEPQLIEQ